MNIAAYIDHTVLSPTTTQEDVAKLCVEAIEASFAAVCVPPYYVKQAADIVKGTPVHVATVIGFPFGYSHTDAKLREIETAMHDGATELDIVHNLAALKNGDWAYLRHEINVCIQRIHHAGNRLKLIVESGVLSEHELETCCAVYQEFPLDFMKTSTGYAATGATIDAVQTMRRLLPAAMQIKASGGIRSFEFARELILAGATRLGCSASMKILEESKL